MSDEDITQFIALTDANEDQAKAYLQKYGAVETAINNWFDTGGVLPEADATDAAPEVTADTNEQSEESSNDDEEKTEKPAEGESDGTVRELKRTVEQNLQSASASDKLWKVYALTEICQAYACPRDVVREIGQHLAYLLQGFWNALHCSETIKIDGLTITKLKTGWGNVIGTVPGSYRVEVLERADGFMMIGMSSNKTDPEGENSEKCGYFLYSSDCSLWSPGINRRSYGASFTSSDKYNSQITKGQVIEVVYANNSIRYIIDGIDCGVAFEDLPNDVILYPSIDFYYERCSLRALF